MKKSGLLTLVLAVAALVLVPVWVTADDHDTTDTVTTGSPFLDEDGDGFSDNFTAGRHGRWLGRGNGPNFIDEDGDGVCDNYTGEPGTGTGYGMGQGHYFVDEDGDGVRDNYTGEPGTGTGYGMGYGMGQGHYYVDEEDDGVRDDIAKRTTKTVSRRSVSRRRHMGR